MIGDGPSELVKQAEGRKAEMTEYVPRTSPRWLGRTKGQPYSRCKMLSFIPSRKPGEPGRFILKHPTRRGRQVVPATPELIEQFVPAAPLDMRNAMLGRRFL
jgi:hypothetical protein